MRKSMGKRESLDLRQRAEDRFKSDVIYRLEKLEKTVKEMEFILNEKRRNS